MAKKAGKTKVKKAKTKKVRSNKTAAKKSAVIIYLSRTGNTKKIAEAIAKGLNIRFNVKMLKLSEAKHSDIDNADVVGIGSGIYAWNVDRKLLKFVKTLPVEQEKLSFTFSTSGSGRDIQLTPLKREMNHKGLCITGSLSCKGKDTFGPLKWFGGIYKDRPNATDLKRAEEFGKDIARMF